MTITKRDLLSAEHDQRIMADLLLCLEDLIADQAAPDQIGAAIDRVIYWASYESRLEKAEARDHFDLETRPAWHAQSAAHMSFLARVLSPHERKRDRWAHYAAAGIQAGMLPSMCAQRADQMIIEEESRFPAKPAENP